MARRLLTAICILAVGGVIFGIHQTGSIFPVLPVGFAISLIAIAIYAIWGDPQSYFPVYLATGVGVVYRAIIFLWPASLIGMDPDAYAVQVVRIAETGAASGIDFSFYNVASVHFWPAVLAYKLGLSPADSLVVYPILAGLIPAFSAAIAIRTISRGTYRVATLASVLGAGMVWGIKYSYAPISQMTAGVVFLGCVYLLASFIDTRRQIFLVGYSGGAVLLTFTHKLPVLMLLVAAVPFLLLEVLTRFRSPGVQTTGVAVIIGVIPFALFLYQMVFMTDFASVIIARTLAASKGAGIGVHRGPTRPLQAVPPLTGTRYLLLRFGGAAIAIGVAAIAWVYLYLYGGRRRIIRYLLGAIAGLTALSAFSITVPSVVQPVRIHFFNEGLLAALIAISLTGVLTRYDVRNAIGSRGLRVLATSVIAAILLMQLGTVPAVPDYPDQPRYYLSNEEVAAKGWSHSQINGGVHSDFYYALEVIPSQIEDRADSPKPTTAFSKSARQFQFQPVSRPLLDATLLSSKFDYFALRTRVDVFRTGVGIYRLKWDPERRLDRSRSTVYDNGGVRIYHRN